MDPIARDLTKWIPTLLDVWRAFRKGGAGAVGAPEDRLLPNEQREVAAAVRALSKGLTGERLLSGSRYMDDPKLLGGYLLFYWPISYAQARYALRALGERPRGVLDLGSGPAPMAFAALDGGAREVVAADRSEAALELARALAAHRGEALSIRVWKAANQPIPDGRFSLITASHLINELWTGQLDAIPRRTGLIERAFEHLEPNGRALILEPALRETSRGLLEVRDLLLGRGIVPLSPCLYRDACPALSKETDWCHAEIPWEPPRLVADLARAAGLHKEALKMTALLLARSSEARPCPTDGDNLFRIVSEPLASKGRQRFMGCGPRGRVGLSLQTKHISESNARFARLQRGDLVRIEGFEEKGDGLALLPDSRVEFVR
ncbi:MAG: small ribosomal subunit Rsm22 family protein [Myxococcales bacterium]|jgi:ribosomal protein RSM22 (predicted rRNA methylase)|nr:small ribosomal subunit Rsm22 family protein [Myxococcales bacterium]